MIEATTKDLTPQQQSAVRVAKAQAKFYAAILRRNAQEVSQDNEALLTLVFAALDNASEVGSVCVTPSRFAAVTELFGETRSMKDVIEELLAKRLIVESAFPNPTPTSPLIADCAQEWRLYDERNFYNEIRLAQKISSFVTDSLNVPAVFDPKKENERAVELAACNRLTIVSGGPGTGKTTAVMKILKALLDKKADLSIVLAAPTGKAAGRMQQAVVAQAQMLDEGQTKAKLSELKAQTIHRLLLTPMPDGNRPSASTPLDCDVLVLDESSMIEIELAVRLFDALDEKRTKVILLGDRHQLAAVGPGAVFADLSDTNGSLNKNISLLKFSHRFAGDKAVGQLSEAINRGDVKAVLEQLNRSSDSPNDNKIVWHHSQAYQSKGLSQGLQTWLDGEISELKHLLEDNTHRLTDEHERTEVAEKFARLMQRFGVLCAQRNGPMSVNAVNNYVDEKLTDCGYLGQAWRQIIVRQNDDILGVHNGDVGVVVPGLNGEADDVYFPAEDGFGRFIKLGLLPQYELAFAITIHQSQGSEYERVAVVMPSNTDSGLATRELLYTAVTRVKDRKTDGNGKVFGTLDIFADELVLKQAVATPVMREGALPQRISVLVNQQVDTGTKS